MIYHRLRSVRGLLPWVHVDGNLAVFARAGRESYAMIRHEMEAPMNSSRQRPLVRSLLRVGAVSGALAIALVIALATMGCESTPIRAFHGARHYAAGTDALVRQDGTLAIVELERAADFVPLASEIQNHLGLAYWSDGRTQAAKIAFEKAIELDCDNRAAQLNFARLASSNGYPFDVNLGEANRVDQNGR